MALQPTDVAQFIVAKAQESLQGFAFEQLLTWVEVDIQLLGIVHVVHALGYIHLHAAEGIGQLSHRLQIQAQIAVHRCLEQLANLPFRGVDTASYVEGICFYYPKFLRLNKGVPGHLHHLGNAIFHLYREHHIGVVSHIVGAQHQQAPLADQQRVDQRRQGVWTMEQGRHRPLGQPGQGPTEAIARCQAQQEGQQRGQQRARASGFGAGLAPRHRWGVGACAAAAAAGCLFLVLSPAWARALLARLVAALVAFWAGGTGLGLRHGES